MKKYFSFIAAALMLLLSACTNDDIQMTSKPTCGVTINIISTQGPYDEFGITNDFKNRFLSGSYNIGVYTFIYDEAGNLSASDSVYSQTFGSLSQKFYLKPGKYTSVTVEMLVDADADYQSESWILVGKEKLSTLEIVNKTYRALWYTAVGTVSSQFEVKDGMIIQTDVTPKAIGAIIEFKATNFDKSDFKHVAFYTKNNPKGRFLSPNFTGDERFHYSGYTAQNTWTNRGYYYYSNGVLPSDLGKDIYVIEEGTLQYCFGALKVDANGELINSFKAYPSNNVVFDFKDGKTYYGGFYYQGGSSDKCTAGLFNTKTEYNNWYNLAKAENVDNQTEVIPSVYTTWGGSVSSVTNFMSSYTQTLGTKTTAQKVNDNVYEIQFQGKGKESQIIYDFTSANSGLSEVDIVYPVSSITQQELVTALGNKYQCEMTEIDGTYACVIDDAKTFVLCFPHPSDANYVVVGYVDISSIQSSSSKGNITPVKKRKILEQLLK